MLVAPIKAQTHLKPALEKKNIAWAQLNSDSLMFYIQSWRNKESLYCTPIQFPSRLRFIWSLLWRGNKLHAFIKIVTDTFHNASRELVSYSVLKKHCWNNFCNINLFSGLLFTLCVFTLFLNPNLFLFLFLEKPPLPPNITYSNWRTWHQVGNKWIIYNQSAVFKTQLWGNDSDQETVVDF